MYLLECSSKLEPILAIAGWGVFLIQMGIPIALIILGMLDLGKAVIASKEDEIKKAKKAFGQRFLYAVGVFIVVWAVKLVLSFIPNIFTNEDDRGNTTAWEDCWKCVVAKGVEGRNNCNYTDNDSTTDTDNDSTTDTVTE